MATKQYQDAYDAAESELEALLKEQERIEGRILSLRKSMNALAQLIVEGGGKEPVGQIVDASLTEDIRKVMTASWPPLTTSAVKSELEKLGWDLSQHSNPLATINAILNRLHEQGFVTETMSGGRKAWQRCRPGGGKTTTLGQVARPRKTFGQRLAESDTK